VIALAAALAAAVAVGRPGLGHQAAGTGKGAASPAPASVGSGWKNAAPGRVFRFPADHASHPEYRIEWWYYTGNLATRDGHRFGYQLTFFRIGVNLVPTSASRWAVRDLFMAHFAVTDIQGARHVSAEKLTRPGVATADAHTDTFRVWNGSWGARLEEGRHVLQAESFAPPFAIDLVLDEGKPPVLQGEGGYSEKGAQPGNASHYYSLTRMPTRGSITLGNTKYDVTGASWMDHEFGTSFLEAGQVGWDWFALQLDDGSDLMLYGLRLAAGGVGPRSSGSLVDAAGRASRLRSADYALTPGRAWTSPATRGTYPVEWAVSVPGAQLDLAVRAAVNAQEVSGLSGVSYWEGTVEVTGRRAGRRVTGQGYLEMTGYAGPPLGQFLQAR
jgi:predicted secreted hydrolase